jgi:GDP-D-mannose dehydratase
VEALKRPADLAYSAMDPSRIAAQLGWAANRSVQEIVAKMYRAELY